MGAMAGGAAGMGGAGMGGAAGAARNMAGAGGGWGATNGMSNMAQALGGVGANQDYLDQIMRQQAMMGAAQGLMQPGDGGMGSTINNMAGGLSQGMMNGQGAAMRAAYMGRPAGAADAPGGANFVGPPEMTGPPEMSAMAPPAPPMQAPPMAQGPGVMAGPPNVNPSWRPNYRRPSGLLNYRAR